MSARILIVDDDPLVPRTLRLLLKKHGHDVEAAAGAEEAFRMLAEKPAHLVISDINMPGADGFEVLKRVKKHGDLFAPLLTLKQRLPSLLAIAG